MPAASMPINESARLRSLHSTGLLYNGSSDDLDTIVRSAADLMDMPHAALSFITKATQWTKSSFGAQGADEIPRQQAFCAHAILDPYQLLVVPDARSDPRFFDNPLVTGARRLRAYVGAPVYVEDNLAIGALCVTDTKPRSFSLEQLKKFEKLALVCANQLKLTTIVNEMHRLSPFKGSPAGNVAAHQQIDSISEDRETYVAQKFLELKHALYSKGQPRIEDGTLRFGKVSIDGNHEFVDALNLRSGAYASIFKGAVRVTSNIMRRDGSRHLGTRLVSGPAFDAVMNKAQPYSGKAILYNQEIHARYEPIMSRAGVIGIVSVGAS